jgi:uncharacterized membrane protein (UPF0127 family)
MMNMKIWRIVAVALATATWSCSPSTTPPASEDAGGTVPAEVAAARAVQPTPREPLNPKNAQALPESPLTISSGDKTHRFTVELADDDTERGIGLMHRGQMGAEHGMLFDFFTPRRVAFWMRNTFIPLDMLFLKSDGEVVSIFENVTPHSEDTVGPDRPVRAVLELNAGTAKKLGLKPGDVVHHAAFKNAP